MSLYTGLDKSTEDAIDALLLQKLAAKEKATVEGVDPLLEELVASEWRMAEDWVSEAPRDGTRTLWEEASRLHLELSETAFK